MMKVEIYEKGITYHSSLTIDVKNMKRLRELEEILIETGHMYRVTPVEDETVAHGADGTAVAIGGGSDDF